MKILKLYEEYVNSASNRISTLLNNMVKMFKETFEGKNDVLGEKELEVVTLVDVERSTSYDEFEKNIILNFTDNEFYYQVIFIVKLDDVKNNDPITKAYMKIKLYDNETSEMLREWQGNLDIKQSTEDEINEEGRFFVKVKLSSENETLSQGQEIQSQATSPAQKQAQGQGGQKPMESANFKKGEKLFEGIPSQNQGQNDAGFDFIEIFIISKIGELKTQFEK
ncbi:MAG: hypothetical protein HPY57_14120 [Ignavibacteria bacterium]|nr:hypothetical protein [Ignavibacteria bacterium]